MPVLVDQYQSWGTSRPLAGMRVLDATPVFGNTLAKHAVLLNAGAQLSVGISQDIAHDVCIIEKLRQWGVPILTPEQAIEEKNRAGDFDIVMDCAGVFSQVTAQCGYVELTRSGVSKYEKSVQPVFVADGGRIKEIETCLGTGDGFLRGLAHFHCDNIREKSVIVFGYGKVGRGVVLYAQRAGARLIVVDEEHKSTELPTGVDFIAAHDKNALYEALSSVDMLVAVTGVKHALAPILDSRGRIFSRAILVNMGVEDEFGPGIAQVDVLNKKFPVNFALSEPTKMCYIEATMALHNYGAIYLMENLEKTGLIMPPEEWEESRLMLIRKKGIIGDELDNI